MQLAHVRVKNFRSLRDVSVSFGDHTALIGGNGAGKSSILKAIEKFYSTKTLDSDDYFGRDASLTVEIELTFRNLSPQETKIFESRVRDGYLTVTRVFDGSPLDGRYFGSVMQNPDFTPIRSQSGAAAKLAAYRELRNSNERYRQQIPAVSSAAAADGAMLAWESAHPGDLTLQRDDGQFFGFQNASRGALKRFTNFVFIPAVREAAVDAADGKSSIIGQLLEILVRGVILQRKEFIELKKEISARYQQLVQPENMPELAELALKLTADIKALYRDAEVGLNWREASEFPLPLPVADVSLHDDGFGGPVDRQGHGLQRAFVVTLLQQLAKTTAQSTSGDVPSSADDSESVQAPSLILAIEEPELYQHPTKQRHFATVLRSLSKGMLPGLENITQVMICSHSPMFVSLDRSDEIRLARRVNQEGDNIKHCELRSLHLSEIAADLETAWGKPIGSFTAATLKPRLHILGTEIAEGFFANGVVLVEGRSDKAMLYAAAKILNIDFEEAGIAVIAVDGKLNLDRPYAIFRRLGIPTFMLWDCDLGKKDVGANIALLRLVNPQADLKEASCATYVGDCYAHFQDTLEALLKAELTKDVHSACLATACAPFGLSPSEDNHKIPEVMYRTLLAAQEQGIACPTLEALVCAIWLHLTGKSISRAHPSLASAA